MKKCVFCEIIAYKLPAAVLWSDENVIVIPDIAPQVPVHNLIISRVHVANVLGLEAWQESFGISLIRAVRFLAEDNSLRENFRLLINSGAQSGQTVFHLHCHFLAP